ncbi:enoyl-CoA hydratase/isomerase family protein [Terrarubrum flagellatum]|uniref:enoyl-CoA hydratase/isomerase family protein n=1 Tax=Terrirubrum flagellatum TaxID=2895980 RepID=UPI003144EABC
MAAISYETYGAIAIEREGRALTLTLNRPDALNAVDARMHAELARIFEDVARDDSVDVVIFTGAGRAFCAGGDLGWLRDTRGRPEAFAAMSVEARRIICSLLDLEKPVICRLNGDAVGLGATLALFSDVVIASDAARIGDPHVRIGLVAGDGGAGIWPHLVGHLRAKEFLMTGDLISATEAASIGLINRAVPADQLDAEIARLRDKLLRGPRQAIRWTKLSINIGLKKAVQSAFEASLAYEVASAALPDHAEGVDALLEGRRPRFNSD